MTASEFCSPVVVPDFVLCVSRGLNVAAVSVLDSRCKVISDYLTKLKLTIVAS